MRRIGEGETTDSFYFIMQLIDFCFLFLRVTEDDGNFRGRWTIKGEEEVE